VIDERETILYSALVRGREREFGMKQDIRPSFRLLVWSLPTGVESERRGKETKGRKEKKSEKGIKYTMTAK